MNPFIGQVILFGGNFAPRGWAFCDGQLLPISSNTALFSILGTTYGGDGRTTFALPDYKDRTVLSPGRGPGLSDITLGEKGGNTTNTLTVANLPQAQIRIPASEDDAASDEPTGKSYALTATQNYNNNVDATMANGSIQGAANQAVNNMQPYLGMRHIIALVGTYPSRS